MNQLKMTFGVDSLNQLGEFIATKRSARRKRVKAVESAMDDFLNTEKIEAFLAQRLNVVESTEIGSYRCDWMQFPTHDEVVLIKTTTNEVLQYEWFDTPEGAKRYYERSSKMAHIFNKLKR